MTPLSIPEAVQQRLAARLYYTGKIDGALGPLTMRALMAEAARSSSVTAIEPEWARSLTLAFAESDISSRLRICHALAQATVETDYWRTLVEYGSSGYFAKYDNRLGNRRSGEGYCYRGRGFIQLTGRDNYTEMGKRIDVDLINAPSKAADPLIAGRIFGEFWSLHDINGYADRDDVRGVTRVVNGGRNGLAARTLAVNHLKAIWPA